MNKISKKYSLFLLITLSLGVLLLPTATSAKTYPTGTLIKLTNDSTVYYIASNGKRYPFPDEATYFTWNRSFSTVKTITKQALRRIPDGKYFITIRPGAKLVKFKGPKVYAVSKGATLHWVKNEQLARGLYGPTWNEQIIELPLKNLSSYIIGEDISEISQYDRVKEKRRAVSVNVELPKQAIIETAKISQGTKSNVPTLKSLKANLQTQISPAFKPEISSYRLIASYEEDEVRLMPMAHDPNAEIKINNTPIASGMGINFKLKKGDNKMKITVSLNNDSNLDYNLNIIRLEPNNNVTLTSLKETLADSLSPAFSPDQTLYKIKAKYSEEVIKLIPRKKDKRSTIRINGKKVESGKPYSVQLKPGENQIQVTVTAQSGKERIYNIDVDRAKRPSLIDAELISLRTSLRNKLSPRFNSKQTSYNSTALASESKIQIYARSRSRYGRVFIDQEETQTKTIRLSPGENEVKIRVISVEGAEMVYTIIINRSKGAF